MPDKNKDKDVPWAESFEFGPVVPESHKVVGDLPIFWGPEQLTLNFPAYDPPKMRAWHANELLSIPRVCRFIYAVKDAYDENEYNDAGVSPPPVPPTTCYYLYEIISPSIAWSVKEAYRTSGNEVGVYPDPEIMEAGGSQNYAASWENRNAEVTIRNGSDMLLYEGSAYDCPYFRHSVSRQITWTAYCTVGTPTVISEVLLYSMAEGKNPTDPPRCWAPLIRYDSDLDRVVEAPENGYVSEVPFSAQNWYGCAEDPEDPPLHPPPPNSPPPPPP